MRIGPLTIERTPEAVVAATPRAPRELGASGTVNLDGFLQSLEYNADLTGETGINTFERMRSADGSVAEALAHITAPIRNATWEIEPASTELIDLEIAEAVRRSLFVWPAQPWSEYLEQALDYLVFGHQVFETVWQVVSDELAFADPNVTPAAEITVPARQFLTFRRFAPRLPKTIWRWNMDGGDLLSITQNTWRGSSYEQVEIPAEQLVVFVNGRRGDDMTGRSLLRAAYKHWVMKETVEKIEVIALERHGVGVWVAYPAGSAANDAAILDRLEDILQNLRAGAQTYIVAPGPKGQSSVAGQDGYLFELVTPGGTPPDFKAAKEYHRGEIKGSVLVRFSELGHASVGARATGDTQSEVWKDALHAVARHICEVNDAPIRRFVAANYGHDRYPKLTVENIESRSLEEFATGHAKLVAAGAITPDVSYRAFVRRETGAPPEDDPAADASPDEGTADEPDESLIEEE